jgi:hypothetical protein
MRVGQTVGDILLGELALAPVLQLGEEMRQELEGDVEFISGMPKNSPRSTIFSTSSYFRFSLRVSRYRSRNASPHTKSFTAFQNALSRPTSPVMDTPPPAERIVGLSHGNVLPKTSLLVTAYPAIVESVQA